MEIRSYGRVFALERRIYRVDRLRLNPAGIPLRGVVYFLVILIAALLVARLPLVSVLVAAVPWYLRDVALPAIAAVVTTAIRIEGRPFHLAARSLVRHQAGPRRVTGIRPCRTGECSAPGGRWYPEPLVVLPDGSDADLRRLRYEGPGAVLVAVPHERHVRRRTGMRGRRAVLVLRRAAAVQPLEAPEVIVLERGATLRVA